MGLAAIKPEALGLTLFDHPPNLVHFADDDLNNTCNRVLPDVH